MTWIILGVVFFAVTAWSLKGTTFVYCERRLIGACYQNIVVKKQYVPIWVLIVIFLICCIPVINLLSFITYTIWFFTLAFRNPDKYHGYEFLVINLSNKNTLHKIAKAVGNFLTKPI